MCLGLVMDNEAGGGWIKEDFPCRSVLLRYNLEPPCHKINNYYLI